MSNESINAVAARIRAAMEKSRMSYGELSNKTGISKAMLQRYATGITGKIPINRVAIIAKALNVLPSYILGWEDDEQFLGENDEITFQPEYTMNDLTKDECELIDNYRNCDPFDQQTLRYIAEQGHQKALRVLNQKK